jgi:hypothetical protein
MVPPVHRKLITSSLMLTVATLNGIVPRGRARVTLGGLRRFRAVPSGYSRVHSTGTGTARQSLH